MALQVWLPLNKDLRNNGLENVTVSQNGGTFSNSGCMCCSSNSPAWNYEINPTNHFSMSFWIKIPASITSSDAWHTILMFRGNEGGSDMNPYISWTSYNQIKIWDTNGHQLIWRNLEYDKWLHIALISTFDNGTYNLKMYKDGELYGEATNSSDFIIKGGTLYLRGGNSSEYSIGFSDFRIYDHALSVKEVKELAKGLYLHYTFDDAYVENTVNYIDINKLGSQGGSLSWLDEYWGGTRVIRDTVVRPSVYNNAGFNKGSNDVTFSTSPSYMTLSFWARLQIPYDRIFGGYCTFQTSSGNVTKFWSWNISDWYNNSSYIGKWQKIIATVEVPSNSTSLVHFYVYGDMNTTGVCDYAGFQFEPKNHATPYTPSSRTTTILPDNSGFGNDGTINGNLQVLSGSARGSYCTKVSPGTITVNNINIPDGPVTLSFWNKPTNYEDNTDASKISIRFAKCEFFTYINYPYFIHNTDYKMKYENYWADGKWHLITSVYDGTTPIKMYIDSKPITLQTGSGSRDYISDFSAYFKDNNISDLRLYKTALSESDIQNLYKDSFIIDDTQNSYCYELNESDTTTEVKMNETGVAKCKNFSESITSVFDDTEYIEPDGSVWIRIFHHNSPSTNSLFASTDSFTTSVYKDANRWFNVSVCNKVSKWELMVKLKTTSEANEYKARWIQNANPMTATLSEVTRDNITINTTSGYTDINVNAGGIMKGGSSYTYLNQAKNTGSGWYAGIGEWGLYSGGIERFLLNDGYWNAITTGYLDLYIRIDNLEETTDTKIAENGTLTAKEMNEI